MEFSHKAQGRFTTLSHPKFEMSFCNAQSKYPVKAFGETYMTFFFSSYLV